MPLDRCRSGRRRGHRGGATAAGTDRRDGGRSSGLSRRPAAGRPAAPSRRGARGRRCRRTAEDGCGFPAAGPFRLRLGTAGSFDALRYESCARPSPGPGQVEVQVHATGLNFSDVLKAMGLYPGITDEIVPLGIECAGVVTAVGKGVERFRVGDAVHGGGAVQSRLARPDRRIRAGRPSRSCSATRKPPRSRSRS